MCVCIFNGVRYKLEYILIYKLIIYDELCMSIYILYSMQDLEKLTILKYNLKI